VNPVYEIGSPLYPKITLHLSREHYDGKTFVIEARNTSRTNCYIQSAALNGRPLKEWWIRWRDVVSGGKLELEMGPTANKNWANEGSPPGAET
jgi:putative alpha-1,2-mannosidase